ncbi:hypothetical protein LPJ61_000812 [Coemansia biformis]|uniref:P-loop containing nucleoside triphosphate hydrolase protein n=1 Tax=Coemansia biformis TaxID=1286918 RepID=A0A9W8CXV5_9FUNG|nr:hypothetical protein LPJ61_000812 [Coemansia biformis]
MARCGLFPRALPLVAAVQLATGLCEMYAAFFAPGTAAVPIVGRHASARSNFLTTATALSAVLLLLHTTVQLRATFRRPDRDGDGDDADRATQYAASAVDDRDTDGECGATPLARRSDQCAAQLVDTPEPAASWASRAVFAWPNHMMQRGARQQLNVGDLYRLDQTDQPTVGWERYQHHRKAGRSLFRAVVLTFMPELVLQAVYSMMSNLMGFAGPFFLQRIIRAIENTSDPDSNARGAYLDAFCLLVFAVGQSLLSGQGLWVGRHISVRLNGLMVAELSGKTLRRRGKGTWMKDDDASSASDADISDGKADGDGDDEPATEAAVSGKIMNLLTADFQRVTEVSAYLDGLYSLPLVLIIAIWYMYQLLGVSALLGLLLSIAYVPLSKAMFQYLARLEDRLNAISDERVAAITEVLQGIKAVKLFGWESRFIEKIGERRERQLACLWRMLQSWVHIGMVASLSPMLVLFAIFGLHVVVFGNRLTAEVAFTSLSVFQMIRDVIQHLPGFLTWAIGGYVSLNRIGSFLDQPEVQPLEERVQTAAAADTDAAATALGFVDADLEWESASGPSESPTAVGTPDAAASPATEQTPLLLQLPQPGGVKASPGPSRASLDGDGRMPFALRGLNLQFPLGELSVIAGPTGAGKSSLLAALIGEMTLTRGRVLLPTAPAGGHGALYRDVVRLASEGLAICDIAYVAQETWLRNATIRDNILFGERYDAKRYEEVLRMCALKPDLRILTAGDQTEIGERGITLSGGQTQRVALARAVYSSRRILLIDDCLSAVDAHTGKHILHTCLASSSTLMAGRTRVLVTHHVTMCLPHCQFVVLLRDGEIALAGAPAQLQGTSAFSDVLAELESDGTGVHSNGSTSKGKVGDGAVAGAAGEDPAGSDAEPSRAVGDSTSEDDYNAERLRKVSEQRGADQLDDVPVLQGTLVEEEERETGHVKFSVWLVYLAASGGRWFWCAAISMLVVAQAMTVMQDYWMRLWVSSVDGSGSQALAAAPAYGMLYGLAYLPLPQLQGQKEQQEQQARQHYSAMYWLGIYMAVSVAAIGCDAVKLLYIYKAAVRASRRLHERLLQAVVHATPRFFDTTPLGRIINRFSRDMQTVDEATMETLADCVCDALAVCSVVAIIAAATPAFLVVAAAIALVYAGIARYYLNTSRELKRLESNSMSPLLSLFGELILGVSTIRAFGAKHYYIREALDRIDAHNRAYYMVWATTRWLAVRIEAAGACVSFSCALFLLANTHRIDSGLAGFVLTYALSFSWRMLWLVRNYSTNEFNMNAVERIDQYLRVDQEAPLHTATAPPSTWPATGALAVENLVIEYVPGAPVLRELSLDVQPGEKIGVVGRTGAGKSTLSLALLRFVEATRGRILLDGVDIASVGLEDLRRRVTIIPQDPVLFNGTIRFNLDPLGEYPDELVWDALRRTHLVRERGESQATSAAVSVADGGDSCGDSADRMSGVFSSLDAEIKENGQNLSLGQRQLVALARALVRRSQLIIMDEATASVDFDTDARIQRTIRGPEFAASTLICIAHRLRTIIDYDRVLVLDRGAVAEFDTPARLLGREGGLFRGMCEESGEYSFLAAAAAAGRDQ